MEVFDLEEELDELGRGCEQVGGGGDLVVEGVGRGDKQKRGVRSENVVLPSDCVD